MNNTLLKIRRRHKRKKPEFLRQEYHRHKKRLGRKWRQPMGRTSKLRMKEKARGRQPSVGYGSPSAVRGLSRFGFQLVRVSNMQELSKISDPKASMAVIASGVGAKKKLEIISAAKAGGIMIFNMPKRALEKRQPAAVSGKKPENKPEKKQEKPKDKPKDAHAEKHGMPDAKASVQPKKEDKK